MAEYSVFDCDNHFYETADALTKFLPERYKSVITFVEVNGRTKIAVKGQISDYIPNPTFAVVARPGAQEDYYRKGNPEGRSYREIVGKPMRSLPAFQEPAARIELMDEQGLDRALMFPTLASLVEERLRDDVGAMHAVIHALNEWMYETWQFNYNGLDRIFSTPVITLPNVEKAIAELDWVVERGAKVVLIRPAPVPDIRGSRSFGLPEFDPFWERVVQHDVLVAMHSSDSGYQRYVDDWIGINNEYTPFANQSAFGLIGLWRPIEDSVASLICHGALSRFPALKIAVIENGSSWVEPLLKSLKNAYKKMPQTFLENPIEVFKRNVHVSPFWEDDLPALAEMIGEDNVLFGSDYPHPEGLASPVSYVKELEGAPEETIRKIMGGNLARLMGVSVSV
ncbi:amidohydrolase family protein [Pseudofrankia inefficax]|uniref:Amidohydrolase 2 n=1 Tax=Pseudofrankia inefficax (strain DSM 45817 / CECT 9037 / DDB 130130 / EuI1c) TaxID=298654 RepID=E3IW17_PSEI1|nr:amidohydrolase family protein [Pseudofrankia inefficax]ADP84945.1 amidohydrolase 2 [Pseudofrankia inefficax]